MLHGRVDPLRERGSCQVAAGTATAGVRLALGHLEGRRPVGLDAIRAALRRWDCEKSPSLIAR